MFTNACIETERLLIRPYQIGDLDCLYELQKHPEVHRYIPEPIYSMGEMENIIRWSMDVNKKNTVNNIIKFNLAIIEKTSQKLIGYCGLGPLDFNPSLTELYYALTYDQWGNGYATEASKALLNYAFSVFQVENIVTTVFPENLASIHVLEKLGFQYKHKVQDLDVEFQEFEGLLFFSKTNPISLTN
ncbi:GNAT family N-acetyltransferase [Viridibacillus sp. YIM B01967]|uniref:GNAT family N-acetyltransferase n=1 Tax=Viridibacillus soli TaxID=2798301 RepID=A0ABS1H751_9BACL|nr:GNAT family N-acetyltransferase [Viridibacillus soli]MBK3495226.1 GNAT family N-acetyltransferase [Viridibacillus soli]